MSKYIIFNCPAYKGLTRDIPDWLDNTNCGYYTGQVLCQDCTDCKLKQIVELAKGHTELCKNCEQQIKECGCSDICNAYRLDKILKLLDIQEIK